MDAYLKCFVASSYLAALLLPVYKSYIHFIQHSGVLTLDVTRLPDTIRKLICRVDVNTVTIEIMPCRTAAASFDIADLSAQVGSFPVMTTYSEQCCSEKPKLGDP